MKNLKTKELKKISYLFFNYVYIFHTIIICNQLFGLTLMYCMS